MKKSTITIRYDGADLAEHQMDVSDLAPSLLSLSELYQIANKRFNGDRASIKVLISTDIEHQCFQFDIQVVQNLWDQAKHLLGDDKIASAKEIGEWFGLIGKGGVSGVSVYGLFKYFKWLKERNVDAAELKVERGPNTTKIMVTGDNANITVHSPTFELSKDKRVLNNVQKVVKPITKDGYDSVEFESNGEVEVLSSKDAAAIIEATSFATEELDAPQVLKAWIAVYSPVYDKDAKSWRFRFGEPHFYMDISETNIASDAINRGGAMVQDAYYVRLQISQERKDNGNIKNHYKILEVLDFKPAQIYKQTNILDGLTHEIKKD